MCPPDEISVGASSSCCDRRRVYRDATGLQACCRQGELVNGQCRTTTSHGVPLLPKCAPGSKDPRCCATGYKPVLNGCCLANHITSQGLCCPPGQAPGLKKYQVRAESGSVRSRRGKMAMVERVRRAGGQLCATGLIPAADGVCCGPERSYVGRCLLPGRTTPESQELSHMRTCDNLWSALDHGLRRLLSAQQNLQGYLRSASMLSPGREPCQRSLRTAERDAAASLSRRSAAQAGWQLLRTRTALGGVETVCPRNVAEMPYLAPGTHPQVPGDCTGEAPGPHQGNAPEVPGDCTGEVPGQNQRNAPELPGDCTGEVPRRHQGNAPELSGDCTGEVPRRHQGNAPELPGDCTSEVPRRHQGNAAELPGDCTGEVPGRHQGNAPELQADCTSEVSGRHDRNMAKLPTARKVGYYSPIASGPATSHEDTLTQSGNRQCRGAHWRRHGPELRTLIIAMAHEPTVG